MGAGRGPACLKVKSLPGAGGTQFIPPVASSIRDLPLFPLDQTFFPTVHLGGFIPGFASCQEPGVCACSVTQLHLTLCDPGPSVRGISQARTLEGLPFSPLGDLPDPGIEPKSTLLTGRFFTIEPPGTPRPEPESKH